MKNLIKITGLVAVIAMGGMQAQALPSSFGNANVPIYVQSELEFQGATGDGNQLDYQLAGVVNTTENSGGTSHDSPALHLIYTNLDIMAAANLVLDSDQIVTLDEYSRLVDHAATASYNDVVVTGDVVNSLTTTGTTISVAVAGLDTTQIASLYDVDGKLNATGEVIGYATAVAANMVKDAVGDTIAPKFMDAANTSAAGYQVVIPNVNITNNGADIAEGTTLVAAMPSTTSGDIAGYIAAQSAESDYAEGKTIDLTKPVLYNSLSSDVLEQITGIAANYTSFEIGAAQNYATLKHSVTGPATANDSIPLYITAKDLTAITFTGNYAGYKGLLTTVAAGNGSLNFAPGTSCDLPGGDVVLGAPATITVGSTRALTFGGEVTANKALTINGSGGEGTRLTFVRKLTIKK